VVNLPSATAMQGVHVQVSSRRPVRAMDQHSINRASRGGRGHVSEASRFAALGVCLCGYGPMCCLDLWCLALDAGNAMVHAHRQEGW
jgi:hypothetical protein